MKDIFCKTLYIIAMLAIIFLFTWIFFGLYIGLPFYNVCYWYMIVVVCVLIYGWIRG